MTIGASELIQNDLHLHKHIFVTYITQTSIFQPQIIISEAACLIFYRT